MTEQRSRQTSAAPWQVRRNILVAGVLVDALLAAGLVASGSGGGLRVIVVFVFVVLGPGLAITGFLRLPDALTELALAVPLSLAIGVTVAGTMSLADAWRPFVGLVISVLLTVVALGLQIRVGIANGVTNWFR